MSCLCSPAVELSMCVCVCVCGLSVWGASPTVRHLNVIDAPPSLDVIPKAHNIYWGLIQDIASQIWQSDNGCKGHPTQIDLLGLVAGTVT